MPCRAAEVRAIDDDLPLGIERVKSIFQLLKWIEPGICLEGFTDNMWPRYRWSIHYAETLQHKIAALNGYIEELKTEILIRQ
jgi:hypothetical protein